MLASFLRSATDEARPVVGEAVLVVLAHPDDETLGCGALLSRLPRARLLYVTDGAPRDGADAHRAGFPTPAAYAEGRKRELAGALAAAGVGPERLAFLDLPDQGAAQDLAGLAEAIRPHLAGAEIVLTHAFEGGHPDHDATAFAVRAAARIEGLREQVAEMPFYRAGPDGTWLHQSFADEDGVARLRLTRDEASRKTAMLAEHRSQSATLMAFGAADERFRPAPVQDFASLPPGGTLYDRYGWGVDGAGFARRAAEAAAALGFADAWL